jgi:hypothetical protein
VNERIETTLLGAELAITAPPALAARLREELDQLIGEPPASAGAARPVLALREDGTGGDTASGCGVDPVQAALTEITRFALGRSLLLCIHAGVVAGARGLVAIPGASGAGKTTLVAALVRAGFSYVSDEVLAIDRATGQVTPFARPLALDRRSWDLLALPAATAPAAGGESLIRPRDLGSPSAGGTVTDVIATMRRGPDTRIASASRGSAVTSLLAHAFNHYEDAAGSFRAVVSLVRAARIWIVEYRQAPQLAAALADRLGSGAQPGGSHHLSTRR